MTIHSAKGLEFDAVFIACVEDTIVPHEKSLLENNGDIEEERRLFYVAITRARKLLFLTSASQRRKKGKVADTVISPFIDEIPKSLLSITRDDDAVDESRANEYFDQIRARIGH
jgi:DNA helicase-2/ATP-dependent DNA helicase PcrA